MNVFSRPQSGVKAGAKRAAAGPQAVTPELQQWINEHLRVATPPAQIVEGMVAVGWDTALAWQALSEAQRAREAAAQASTASTASTANALPEPDLAESRNILQIDGHPVRVALTLRHPRVVVFEGLLTLDECRGLMAQAEPRLARSETVDNARGGSEVNPARTSDGMFFNRGESPLITRIEARIAALLRWPVSHGEGLQILRYRPGAQYEAHYDYFDPSHAGSKPVLARGGQRVGTLVIYLAAPARGGGTTFPDAGLEVAPVPGNAVFFSYDRPSPATGTLHGGAPVLEGEKWVATKWLREREFR
jgi:prolyl 4-hydroxylase